MNEPYLQANVEYLKSNPDYLAMISSPDIAPDFQAPAAPMATHEEFHVPDIEAPSMPGYINMKPKQGTAIYTPSAEPHSDNDENDTLASQPLTSASFKTSPVQKPPRKSKENRRDTNEEEIPGESIPMLESNLREKHKNNEIETDYKDLMPRHPRDTVISNQYVNVPSATKNNKIDAFSNPSYVAVSNVNERT